MHLMYFGCKSKCIAPRLPQQQKDGGKENTRGEERRETKQKTKQYIFKKQVRENTQGGRKQNIVFANHKLKA